MGSYQPATVLYYNIIYNTNQWAPISPMILNCPVPLLTPRLSSSRPVQPLSFEAETMLFQSDVDMQEAWDLHNIIPMWLFLQVGGPYGGCPYGKSPAILGSVLVM